MERLSLVQEGGVVNLPASLVEIQNKLNELIDERDILFEKVAKLEGECDSAIKRLDQDEKIIMKLISQIAAHHHAPDGKAAIALECLAG